MFPFVLPCFAPTAVLQVIASCFRFRRLLPHFPFLSSGSALLLNYSALSFFLSVLPIPASSWLFPVLPSVFRLPAFRFSPAWFPMRSFRFSYSAFCLFPFVLPCLAPTAALQVLTLRFRLRCFPLADPFFRPSRLGSDYSDFRFSLFPSPGLPLTVVMTVPIYPPSVCLFPCALPVLVLSMLHLPFSGSLARHTAATPAPSPLPFGS